MQKSELLVKEAEIYKSVYCSLCRTLGKDYSFFCRLFLSYDFTFYAVLSMAVTSNVCPQFKRGRCCCNPLKACVYCGDDLAFHAAAALTVITAYYKLCDDICDSGFFKSLFSRIARLFVSRQWKKAVKKYPEFDFLLSEMTEKQSRVEKTDNPSVDACCEPTADMLSAALAMLSGDGTEKRILAQMGYHLGRWIYLADAADDLEKDKKTGSFNCLIPLSLRFDDKKDFISECNALMNMAIAGAFSSYQLLNVKKFGGILSNHFLYGMQSVQKRILLKDKAKRKDSRKNEQSV